MCTRPSRWTPEAIPVTTRAVGRWSEMRLSDGGDYIQFAQPDDDRALIWPGRLGLLFNQPANWAQPGHPTADGRP